ncbi:MAG: hypothetical protein QN162_04230 [Armatimonadota bacterium]|nr:hypothetical protein [Armatimonadota bacterium]
MLIGLTSARSSQIQDEANLYKAVSESRRMLLPSRRGGDVAGRRVVAPNKENTSDDAHL